jgi:hypothetical protein
MATVLKVGNVASGGSFTPDSTGILQIKTGSGAGTTAMTIDTSQNATFAGTIADSLGSVRSTPINSQTGAYVLTATDNGRTVSITTGGVTAPASVLAASNIVTIYNNSGSSQTITQGSGLTLQWAGQATSTTGNRTLGLYGIATILYITPTNAVISGAGLT